MDFELKQKFAPRRDRRHTHVHSLTEASSWARSLDWSRNDYDFFQLCRSVFQYLDWRYRDYGFRIDQFASHDELMQQARRHAEYYRQERFAECIDFYRFLYASLDMWIGGLASAALDIRRQNANSTATWSKRTKRIQ